MKYNKLVFIRSIIFLTTTIIISLSFFNVLAFAQSSGGGEEEGKERMNQTVMQDNITKSTNQPIQNNTQITANETCEAFPIQKNVTDLGANITEGTKDVIGIIGEKLQDLGK